MLPAKLAAHGRERGFIYWNTWIPWKGTARSYGSLLSQGLFFVRHDHTIPRRNKGNDPIQVACNIPDKAADGSRGFLVIVGIEKFAIPKHIVQLQDLRALVTSQQKVLMYMGKDMELAQPAEVQLSLVPSRAIPYRDRDKNSSRDRREASAEASQAPYLNA